MDSFDIGFSWVGSWTLDRHFTLTATILWKQLTFKVSSWWDGTIADLPPPQYDGSVLSIANLTAASESVTLALFRRYLRVTHRQTDGRTSTRDDTMAVPILAGRLIISVVLPAVLRQYTHCYNFFFASLLLSALAQVAQLTGYCNVKSHTTYSLLTALPQFRLQS